MTYHQATYDEPLLSEIHSDNRYKVPEADENIINLIPEELRTDNVNLPVIAEYDVVRHFTRLSQMNYGVDLGIYPLGSCTMKFNPKFADRNIDSRIVEAVRKHTGAGITREEASSLSLPGMDFIPSTLEEMIVAHADNLVAGKQYVHIDDVVQSYSRKGLHQPAKRLLELHRRLTQIIGTDPDRIVDELNKNLEG